MDLPRLTPVRKPKGYKFDAISLGPIVKLDGTVRYVAENPDGIIHIFRRSQLEVREDG